MVRITDDILYRVEKPSRYVGGELNEVIKDPKEVDIRFGFCFPDVYEVGMSHLGSRILYHVLNQRKDNFINKELLKVLDEAKKLNISQEQLIELVERGYEKWV